MAVPKTAKKKPGARKAQPSKPAREKPENASPPADNPRDPDQAWFWSERWQAMERKADEEIAAGK